MSAQDQVDLCRPVAVPGTHWPGYLGMYRIQSTSSTVCVSPNPRGDSAKRDMVMSRGLSVHSANGEAGVQEEMSAKCESERGICFVHRILTRLYPTRLLLSFLNVAISFQRRAYPTSRCTSTLLRSFRARLRRSPLAGTAPRTATALSLHPTAFRYIWAASAMSATTSSKPGT